MNAVSAGSLALVSPASDPSGSLAAQLRHRTRAAHEALEAHPLLARLTSDTLTRPDYQRIIERLLGFYAPLESLLSRPAAAVPGFDAHDRWKTPLLAHDLDVLRHSRASYPPVPRCATLPNVTTPSQALGVWYVAEGATLGGRIIVKHVRRTLGLSAGFGASFFAGYQDATGRRWRAFLDLIEARHAAGQIDGEACVQAATDTFTAFTAWFDAAPPVSPAPVRPLHGRFAPSVPSAR